MSQPASGGQEASPREATTSHAVQGQGQYLLAAPFAAVSPHGVRKRWLGVPACYGLNPQFGHDDEHTAARLFALKFCLI